MANLSIEKRAAVVTLSKEGYSGRAIAKSCKSVCVVQEILKKARETGTVKSDQVALPSQQQDKIPYFFTCLCQIEGLSVGCSKGT